ncbi:hypothetical protein Poli38472_011234 [Pythium oligandrum]|uniref:LisH domain-containing protein n=1 Tax=Pythium oligandrum TaxID=41045 RepID=A0A8K1CQ79_PYTOL|nr:hypothetical protein Poli38472_011234 [Pythium oligandrum]|eukprot:TMW67614.1 hypothetical protein Poli38472_011234 [Pythium oligandrum]
MKPTQSEPAPSTASSAPCPPPISMLLQLKDPKTMPLSPPSAMVASGFSKLRKVVQQPIFENFNEKVYLIRSPTQMMRLIDGLRYHKPTEKERAELNLSSSKERIYLHDLNDLLLVCGAKKGFRFTSTDINKLRQTAEKISDQYDRLDHEFKKIPLEVTQFKFPAHVQRVEDGEHFASRKELLKANAACESLPELSHEDAVRRRALHFQWLARGYIVTFAELRDKVVEIRERFLKSISIKTPVGISTEPVDAEFEAKVNQPFPAFLHCLIQKYHREQRRKTTDWNPSCPEPPVDSIGIFAVYLSYVLEHQIPLTAEELHSFEVLLQVLKLSYDVDVTRMRISDVKLSSARLPFQKGHSFSSRFPQERHVSSRSLCTMIYTFLSTVSFEDRGMTVTRTTTMAEEDVMLRAVAAVEDDERLMSMEELKQEMFRSLKDTGTVEAIRAQLRRRFIEKLKQHGRKARQAQEANGDVDPAENDEEEPTVRRWTLEEQLIHGLVHDYLERHGLEHTTAVFVPEIGGVKEYLPSEAILEMLKLPTTDIEKMQDALATGTPLVTILIKDLLRRASVTTMSSGTQTAMDCHDHRIQLENQLRRVENTFLAETAHQKANPLQSFEERVLRYQREYDELCEKRLQEDLERFKTTELALMRVEERKRYERESESLKATLFQEHRDRLRRLQDQERELELAFSTKRTELETAMFEARQRLFQEMEKLRVKQAELEAKQSADFRQFALETKRLQLWEEKVKAREENMDGAVSSMVDEKEKGWALERIRWQNDIRNREQVLQEREEEVSKRLDTAKRLEEDGKRLRDEINRLEAEMVTSQDSLAVTRKDVAKLEREKTSLEHELGAREAMLSEDKHSMKNLSYENVRLLAEKKALELELSKAEDAVVERTSEARQLDSVVKELQHQLLELKMSEANAVVEERKKSMQVLEDERSNFRWRENELVGRIRELQTRLAESEAAADKYQGQYEDEKVHVESLRHEVSSLNALLVQAQSTITAKHSASARSGSRATDTSVGGGGDTERMLIRMMEMMSRMAGAQAPLPLLYQPAQPSNLSPPPAIVHASTQPVNATANTLNNTPAHEDQEETRRLREEQDRIERELLEQREYNRKKKEREEQEAREMEARRKKFEDEMALQRQQSLEEEQRQEESRKKQLAEEQVRLQQELERHRKVAQDATELQRKLLEDQIAQEQARLQTERAHQERLALEKVRFDEEMEERRRQRLKEEEAEQERLRTQRVEEEVRLEARRRELLLEEQERMEALHRVQHTIQPVTDASTPQGVEEKVHTGENEVHARIDHGEQSKSDRRVMGSATSEEEEANSTGDVNDVDDIISEMDRHESEASLASSAHSTHSEGEDKGSGPNLTTDTPVEDSTTVELTSQAVEAIDEDSLIPEPAAKSPEELEEERRKTAEEAKKKEDEAVMDVYRQRVLARKAAEKQRQLELEEQQKREEEERAAAERARLQEEQDAESENELELSGGSFAESSAASSSGSF